MFHQSPNKITVQKFYSIANENADSLSSLENEYNSLPVSLKTKRIIKIEQIISSSIIAIKNEIFAFSLQRYYKIYYGTPNQPGKLSLGILNKFIENEPELTKSAYERLSLELREELKGILNNIFKQGRGLLKKEYQSIIHLCKFPIPKKFVTSIPRSDRHHLLNDTLNFFKPSDPKDSPRDIENIPKDDQLIVRVWKNKNDEIQCVSFEAMEYRCQGSLFLSPICEVNDFNKRIFYNNYISLSTLGRSTQHIELTLIHIICYSIKLPILCNMLNIIQDYMNPLGSLIEVDIESNKSEPTHIFCLSKLNSERIWEYFLNFDDVNKVKSKDPYILLKKNSDVVNKSFHVLLQSVDRRTKNRFTYVSEAIIENENFIEYVDGTNRLLSLLSDLHDRNITESVDQTTYQQKNLSIRCT
jgi:hypothetical protein